MISEVKKIFLERKILSLYDLSIHFDVDKTVMEKMLEILIKKNFIKKTVPICQNGLCSSCAISSCDPSKLIYYEINSLNKS